MTSQKETASDVGTSYHNVLIQIISGILCHSTHFGCINSPGRLHYIQSTICWLAVHGKYHDALLQAFIQQPHSCRVASLNTIICEGDRLFHLTNIQHEFLLPNELPACVSVFNHTFQTNIKTECFSSFTSDASVVCRLLHGALELTSNPYASRYAILCMGNIT